MKFDMKGVIGGEWRMDRDVHAMAG